MAILPWTSLKNLSIFISVKDHKTSIGGPARLTMDSRAIRVLRGYVDIISPRIGNGNKLLLVPIAGGGLEPVSRTDTLMCILESRYDKSLTLKLQKLESCSSQK